MCHDTHLCALVFLAIDVAMKKTMRSMTRMLRCKVRDQLRLALKERPASPLLEYKIGRLFAEYGLMDSRVPLLSAA